MRWATSRTRTTVAAKPASSVFPFRQTLTNPSRSRCAANDWNAPGTISIPRPIRIEDGLAKLVRPLAVHLTGDAVDDDPADHVPARCVLRRWIVCGQGAFNCFNHV